MAWDVQNPEVDIICIVDRSGSMTPITHDVIGGFNRFLKDQKNMPGRARLTLALFDHEYMKLYDRVPLDQVDPLGPNTYKPRGWTALLDAIGKTLSEEYNRHGILFIVTDGYENHSKEFSKDAIKQLIDAKESLGWRIEYLGAHADAFSDMRSLGLKNLNTWVPTKGGTRAAYSNMSGQAVSYRNSVGQSNSDDS